MKRRWCAIWVVARGPKGEEIPVEIRSHVGWDRRTQAKAHARRVCHLVPEIKGWRVGHAREVRA